MSWLFWEQIAYFDLSVKGWSTLYTTAYPPPTASSSVSPVPRSHRAHRAQSLTPRLKAHIFSAAILCFAHGIAAVARSGTFGIPDARFVRFG